MGFWGGRQIAASCWRQRRIKPVPALLPELGLLWRSAQCGKPPLDFGEKIHVFRPLVASTAEPLPLEKAFPKGRFSGWVEGWWPGWRRRWPWPGVPAGQCHLPAASPGTRGHPWSCSVVLVLIFCCFRAVLSQLTLFLGAASPDKPNICRTLLLNAPIEPLTPSIS